MEFKENHTVELKTSLAQLEKALKTICAFLNHKGGIVYFGVDDKGEVVGLDVSDRVFRKISQQIHSRIKPEITPEIREIKVEGKSVIEVKVHEGNNKPYFLNGIAYKKTGTEKRIIPPDELKRIILAQKKTRWDEEICDGAKIEDIDEDKVRWFLRKAKSERGLDIDDSLPLEEALMRLKLMKNEKLTNASILLFGNKSQDFFEQSEVKCVRFKGTDVTGKMLDLKPIRSNILDEVTEAEKFIFDHIKMSAWIESGKIERQEKWEYPPKAIREALVNAVCHRDYRVTSKVQIRIFDDRIEFWNPGGLPEGWTIETLKKKHESIPLNPAIARQFFWIKYIEEVGTGTNKIIEWCSDWGLPEPEFEFTGTSLVVTFKKSRFTVEDIERLHLNERQKKAVEYLKEHHFISNKVYREINLVGKVFAVKELNQMVEKGILKVVGKGRALKYELSD